MFMIEYKQFNWWHWLVIACCLTGGLAGYPAGFVMAIVFTVLQLALSCLRERSVTAFPVQVRFWYLLLLLVALPGPMRSIYWLPTIGTWALLIFGYCAMARCVSLLPWNRNRPLNLALLSDTFFSRPVRGNIQQGLPPVE